MGAERRGERKAGAGQEKGGTGAVDESPGAGAHPIHGI